MSSVARAVPNETCAFAPVWSSREPVSLDAGDTLAAGESLVVGSMREARTGAFLGTACLLAGIGPFLIPGRELQLVCAAAAFCIPAMLPFFFSDRGMGLASVAMALGLVALGSIAGVWIEEPVAVRRALLVRNLQMASAGAVSATLVAGILWARDIVRDARNA